MLDKYELGVKMVLAQSYKMGTIYQFFKQPFKSTSFPALLYHKTVLYLVVNHAYTSLCILKIPGNRT